MKEVLPLVFAVVAQLLSKKSKKPKTKRKSYLSHDHPPTPDNCDTSTEDALAQEIYDWLIHNAACFFSMLKEKETAEKKKNILRSVEAALDAFEEDGAKVSKKE